MRQLWKNRKAISPVVSALLMLMVVMSAFAIIYPFTQQYVSNYQQTTGLALQEWFVIEDVWFTTQDGEKIIKIHVFNAGRVGITLEAVYIRPEGGSEKRISLSEPLSLGVGEDGSITLPYDYTNGVTYHISVVSNRGVLCEGDYTAPS